MYESDEKVDKCRVEVAVKLEDGTDLLGFLFVKQLQRISDLLNDPRLFVPLQVTDGPIVHLHKSKIATVTQLTQEVDQDQAVDPYEVLGVSPSASDEAVKEAYHSLCSDYHPDKLHGLGLPADFNEIANARITRIIDAYRRITAARQNGGAKRKDSPFSPVQ